MKEPVWVLREVVVMLHEQSLAQFGGAAGIRDEGMLDSALGRPQHRLAYGKPTLFELAAGYAFGYWFSRLAKLDKSSARSVSFEVGLQNGGMAAAIANSMNMLGTMGLAAAIFSPWMNISGSILANYWRRRAEKEELNRHVK